MVSILLLPKMVVNLPDMGMVNNCPSGKANKILPNSASDKFIADLRSGILLAQDAKQTPCAKKNKEAANRTRFGLYLIAKLSFGVSNEADINMGLKRRKCRQITTYVSNCFVTIDYLIDRPTSCTKP